MYLTVCCISRVGTLVGQGEAASVAQHVRVYVKGNLVVLYK